MHTHGGAFVRFRSELLVLLLSLLLLLDVAAVAAVAAVDTKCELEAIYARPCLRTEKLIHLEVPFEDNLIE